MARFGLGCATGFLIAVLTSILPVATIALSLALTAMTLVALRRRDTRRTAGLAGILVGLGTILFLGAANTVVSCSQTDNFCGNANVAPLFAYAAALIGIGLGAAVIVAKSSR